MDGRTDDAKTISLRLRRGIIITCVGPEIIWELFCMLDQSELALNCEPSNEFPKLGEIMLTCALELLVPRTEINTHDKI